MKVCIRHAWPSGQSETGFNILYLCQSVPEEQVGLYFWSTNQFDLRLFDSLEEAEVYAQRIWKLEALNFEYLDADTQEVLSARSNRQIYTEEKSEGRSYSAVEAERYLEGGS